MAKQTTSSPRKRTTTKKPNGDVAEVPKPNGRSQADAVDPTGAGDALAAGFLVGGSLEEAARRGLDAAARCIAKVGSLP